MMRLYDFARSSSAWRVRIALALKQIEHERVTVDVSRAVQEQQKPGYDAINPIRQVPVLEWREGDTVRRLSQSVAIIEYLDARVPDPPLYPSDPYLRARTRQYVELVNAGVQPLQNNYVLQQVSELGGDERRWAAHFIGRGLTALEAMVRDTPGPFLGGDAPSAADVFLVPQMFNARLHNVDLSALARLRAAEAACEALEAFASAHPDAQPG